MSMPTLIPANRILEAPRQLSDAINQQPKRAPMHETITIDMLRKVMLREKQTKLPENSFQIKKN